MRNMLLIAALVLDSAAAQAADPHAVTLASASAPVAVPRPTTPPTPQATAPSQPQPPLVRHCTTLDGKNFEWHFPNVPFAVLNCS